VTKRYGRGAGSVLALDGIHLDVKPGEFVCLVGASGCGKSTLLNLVADLDQPTTGTVEVSGKTGVMFQEAALFPWLTVAGNIELAQQLHGVKKAARRKRAEELLEVVHLEGFAKKRPHELSGGMRQRVALARTLAQDSDVLLMDEPFGALDAITRDFLHDELERLYLERGFTVIFVTHNVREAVRLGTRIVLLTSRPGRVAEEFIVDAERPRRMDDPATSALSVKITERLREEVRRHG
jgi:NitT/TauT family transport system ATP-binding protein